MDHIPTQNNQAHNHFTEGIRLRVMYKIKHEFNILPHYVT